MDYYSSQISKLIEELSCLPGIGAKSAARLAFHLIHMPKEEVKRLADTMVSARENVRYCKECYTLTDQELCPICSSSSRDHKTIMVVPGIWQPMRRQEDTTASIMYYMEPFLPCWELDRRISS